MPEKPNLTMLNNGSLRSFYNIQKHFQEKVIKKYGYDGVSSEDLQMLPVDNVQAAKYHMLALMEEVGELVKSDKRWKNFRNTHYDKDNKLEEISDCFITLLNVCLYSGISDEELIDAIFKKMMHNNERV